MHLCWGNYEGPHHCDVPLADIIDVVLLARPNAISLEAANPRHAHEWTLFERVKLPPDKVLIPGVIESKSNFIEHPELIAQRIARYAKLVGRENVIAGSDCGRVQGQKRLDSRYCGAGRSRRHASHRHRRRQGSGPQVTGFREVGRIRDGQGSGSGESRDRAGRPSRRHGQAGASCRRSLGGATACLRVRALQDQAQGR